MQRPVMNPDLFGDDLPASPSERKRIFRLLGAAVWRTIRLGFKFFTTSFLSHTRFRVEDGTPMRRFVRGLMYRLAFVPLFLAATACAVVWTSTHPRLASAEMEMQPDSRELYFHPVTFLGADSVPLDGWLVDVMEPKTIIEEKDEALRKKSPAVVLVHGFGQRRQQMMPLIKPLHEAGYVVLAINLRGGDDAETAGQTFGLLEASDVKAAVDLLAHRPFVDPKRIAVIGIGTGATASLLAADGNPQIAAVIANRPLNDSEDLVEKHLMPKNPGVGWLAPLCKWTFELSYGVNAEDVELRNFKKLFDSKPVMLFNDTDPFSDKAISQSKTFLASAMKTESASVQNKAQGF
jgi:pimeloyl-ACP methyl ester carboxylesterase